jgi:hypothetical protein
MIVPCDWCGAWSGCDKCDDPAVRKMMDELDDPMNVNEGGHIHSSCEEHEFYWQDAHYWTEHENCEDNEDAAACECQEKRRPLVQGANQ